MCPQNYKDGRGRPISGSEEKSKELKIRIEPSLLGELTYVCRVIGISVSQGVRNAIIMFIQYCHKNYR